MIVTAGTEVAHDFGDLQWLELDLLAFLNSRRPGGWGLEFDSEGNELAARRRLGQAQKEVWRKEVMELVEERAIAGRPDLE
jgi:hypothetical protein